MVKQVRQEPLQTLRLHLTPLPAGQAAARPLSESDEQSSAILLAQLVAALKGVTIRNSKVNWTNNTSGGSIVVINNTSESRDPVAAIPKPGNKTVFVSTKYRRDADNPLTT